MACHWSRTRSRGEAAGVARAFGVIGDAQVLEAGRAGGFGHLFEGIAAVAPVGVAVEGAGEVVTVDEDGERAFFGEFDLAEVFTQFGRDHVKAEGAKDLGFGLAGNRTSRAFERVFTELEQTVLALASASRCCALSSP